MTKRKYTKSGLTAEEFIRVWQGAKSLSEVQAKTGLPKASASGRARKYRNAGIPLKGFPRGGYHTLDVKALARIAKQLAPK